MTTLVPAALRWPRPTAIARVLYCLCFLYLLVGSGICLPSSAAARPPHYFRAKVKLTTESRPRKAVLYALTDSTLVFVPNTPEAIAGMEAGRPDTFSVHYRNLVYVSIQPRNRVGRLLVCVVGGVAVGVVVGPLAGGALAGVGGVLAIPLAMLGAGLSDSPQETDLSYIGNWIGQGFRAGVGPGMVLGGLSGLVIGLSARASVFINRDAARFGKARTKLTKFAYLNRLAQE